ATYGIIADNYQKQGELEYNKGDKLISVNTYHEAEKNQLVALRMYQSLFIKESIAACFLGLGKINIKLGNLKPAKEFLDSSLDIFKLAHIKYALEIIYNSYSVLDSIQGNYKGALKNYKLSVAYRDSIIADENEKKAVQIKMQYEFDKRESLAKVAQDKKDADATRTKNQQYLAIGALSIIVLAFIAIALMLFRNNKDKQKANILLESQKQKVESTLTELKSTQSQLIQSEKMASLGELTAGIAHEIQNPLNFVNNFSEVNKELMEEMVEEVDKGNFEEVKAIAKDIIANEEKINHHGKRADAIVKGMLQHSRSSNGAREPTDINALCDEYLRLSYHGLRAKDKSFNATIKTDFDERIGNINIIPQDIGRVILNLLTNAFYAASTLSKGGLSEDVRIENPTVWLSTKRVADKIVISVGDNGSGIPQKVADKIFQPFFTTKPTGQGTGLGLSLSYDIVKAHGGEIKVETKENEGATFIIELPVV
ncbi:MAG: ATP-binding protein, partial [Pelobium sp.]